MRICGIGEKMNETINVKQEYEALLPKLSDEEFKELKSSIKKNGLFYPIIVNENNVILDGHTRFRICQQLGIEAKTERKIFEDKLDEKIFVIETNLKRRQLNKFQSIELNLKLAPLLAEKGRQNKSIGGKIGADLTNLGFVSHDTNPIDKVDSLGFVAKEQRGLCLKRYKDQN